MPPKPSVPAWERKKYASWVVAARSAACRQMLWLPLRPAELRGLPVDVLREIHALKPEWPRYRSTRLGRKGPARIVSMEPPSHVHGFHRVIAAIARHAGCRPPTLYMWVDALRMAAGIPPEPPRGRPARRKRPD